MLLCVSRFRYSVGVGLVSRVVHGDGFVSVECCCSGEYFGVSGFRVVLRFGGGGGVVGGLVVGGQGTRDGALFVPLPLLPSLVRVSGTGSDVAMNSIGEKQVSEF